MRNLRNAIVIGCLTTLASGCAFIPGYPSSDDPRSPGRFFIGDNGDDGIPVAEPKVVTAPEKPGLKIRRSKRGNVESYVVRGERYYTLDSAEGYSARGVASWYGPNFHGRTASSGEVYDMYRLTAAHKTLPLPTYVRVTHVENGKSVVVKINDRGPFSGDRIIDLSFASALKLGMVKDGTGTVEVKALSAEEMLALSGPDNSLDIDFHYVNEDGEEQEPAVIAAAAAELEEEPVVVVAAEVDQDPITALPTAPEQSVTARPTTTTPSAADSEILASVSVAAGAEVESLTAASGQLVSLTEVAREVAQEQRLAQEQQLAQEQWVAQEQQLAKEQQLAQEQQIVQEPQLTQELQASAASDPDSIDAELREALLPVVAQANVQGPATVPAAALQTAPQTESVETGYFIQAGVFADVNDAERVAFDVVLAAPDEEVNVKPLKDSLMYRITVGPIASSDHAGKVSGVLTEAGLENFTVNVK